MFKWLHNIPVPNIHCYSSDADVDIPNYSGITAIQAASGRKYSEIGALLEKYGAVLMPETEAKKAARSARSQ